MLSEPTAAIAAEGAAAGHKGPRNGRSRVLHEPRLTLVGAVTRFSLDVLGAGISSESVASSADAYVGGDIPRP